MKNSEEYTIKEENGQIVGKNSALKQDRLIKRIAFDEKTYRRLKMMLPLFGEGESNQAMSRAVQECVNHYFENVFVKEVQNL